MRISDGSSDVCSSDLGQRQRIALARALYGHPKLVVLDEPNANLDAEGDALLNRAIADLKARGTTVVVIGHRLSTFAAVDKLLVLVAWAVQIGRASWRARVCAYG